MFSRRTFLSLTGAAAGLSVSPVSAQRRGGGDTAGPLPPSIAALTTMRDKAKPITADERRGRIEKAKRLMGEQKIDAIILAGGTSLNYFTGIRWGSSERLFAVVIPRVGNPYIVTPAFEEDRTREQLVARSDGAHRRLGVSGGREPVRAGRARSEGSRHRHRPHRRRGDDEVRVRRQRRRRGAGAQGDQRHADHSRLPDDQGRARGRADAARLSRRR